MNLLDVMLIGSLEFEDMPVDPELTVVHTFKQFMPEATCTQSGITSKTLQRGVPMKAIPEKQAVKQFATMMNKLIANPPTTAGSGLMGVICCRD